MEHKIKALIFDIGGVVLFYNNMIAARKMSKIIGVAPEKIFKALDGQKNKFTLSYELGKPPQIYWNIAAKYLSVKKIPYKKFDEIWTTMFWPNKEMISLIKKLKKIYKIAVLSNIGGLHINYLSKKYKLNELFDVKIYSYKVGARKPDKKIYQEALKKLKVKPSEAVFIDDRLENVKGAKKLGINGIHFKSNKQTIREIERFLR